MNQLFYYLVIKPLSLLPLWVLYYVSDSIFFVVYYVVGYRKSVVFQNLINSFPDKSAEEIKHIQKKFFIHLCDLIVENIRLFSMPLDELKRRFKIPDTSILDNYHNQNRSIILVGGHYNNYELAAIAFDVCSPHQAIGIYSPLSNKFFDKIFAKSRTRYGVEIITKGLVPRSFI